MWPVTTARIVTIFQLRRAERKLKRPLTSGQVQVDSSPRSSRSATPCGRIRRRRTLAPTSVGKRAANEGRHSPRGISSGLPTNTWRNHMVRLRGLGVLIVAAFVAFACGGGGGGTTSKGTIKIGSDLPVCTVGGQNTANGVKFAVDQKNSAGGVNGYTIAYQSFDDCRQHIRRRPRSRMCRACCETTSSSA